MTDTDWSRDDGAVAAKIDNPANKSASFLERFIFNDGTRFYAATILYYYTVRCPTSVARLMSIRVFNGLRVLECVYRSFYCPQ